MLLVSLVQALSGVRLWNTPRTTITSRRTISPLLRTYIRVQSLPSLDCCHDRESQLLLTGLLMAPCQPSRALNQSTHSSHVRVVARSARSSTKLSRAPRVRITG